MEYQGRWYRKVTLRGNDYVYANFGTRNFRVCFPDKLLMAVESKPLADFNFPIITIIELLKRLIRKRTDVIDCGDDKIATDSTRKYWDGFASAYEKIRKFIEELM